jgi:hypothetical protein
MRRSTKSPSPGLRYIADIKRIPRHRRAAGAQLCPRPERVRFQLSRWWRSHTRELRSCEACTRRKRLQTNRRGNFLPAPFCLPDAGAEAGRALALPGSAAKGARQAAHPERLLAAGRNAHLDYAARRNTSVDCNLRPARIEDVAVADLNAVAKRGIASTLSAHDEHAPDTVERGPCGASSRRGCRGRARERPGAARSCGSLVGLRAICGIGMIRDRVPRLRDTTTRADILRGRGGCRRSQRHCRDCGNAEHLHGHAITHQCARQEDSSSLAIVASQAHRRCRNVLAQMSWRKCLGSRPRFRACEGIATSAHSRGRGNPDFAKSPAFDWAKAGSPLPRGRTVRFLHTLFRAACVFRKTACARYPRRSACQTPAQLPSEPWPCQVPLPSPRAARRPSPSACWPAPSTLTRTTPFE